MSTGNEFRSMGLVVGVMVGVVISVLLIRLVNRDRKLRTEYDEMQKIIRGEGYKIAFYTVLIYEGLLILLDTCIQIPAVPMVAHFGAIALGVTVQAGYCIWNDAYVGLNTRLGRFLLVALFATAINAAVAVMAAVSGRLIVDGVLQDPFTNLLCALMFVILGAVAIVHRMAGSGQEA